MCSVLSLPLMHMKKLEDSLVSFEHWHNRFSKYIELDFPFWHNRFSKYIELDFWVNSLTYERFCVSPLATNFPQIFCDLQNPQFILHHNYVALPHCTLLHRSCDVTALRCCIKVKFILTWNAVKLRWLVAESNRYIDTATQLRCGMNGPLFDFPSI